MFAVPFKVLLCRPVCGFSGQNYPLVSHLHKQESRLTRLGKVTISSENCVVIPERPEAVVEEPVGVFAESNAVGGIVVAAAGELVNMAGIDDAAGIERDQSITGQGTGVVVGRYHTDTKAPFPAPFNSFLVFC